MTKIAIQPNASGTGTFTIAAPNSNVDRTFSLPDATGEVLTSAGGTMTGTYSFGGFISLQTSDNNGYPRLNGAASSAQLGLFRSSGGTEGGFFLGGDGGQFSVWSSDFVRRMNVDTAGRVTMPFQPAFNVFRSEDNYPLNVGDTFAFNAARTNVGNHFDLATHRFNAPVAGSYWFTFETIQIGAVSNGQYNFDLNGAALLGSFRHWSNNTGGWVFLTLGQLVYMNAGDFLNVRVGTQTTYHGGTWNSFSGYLIG